jgi:hypothetical protein
MHYHTLILVCGRIMFRTPLPSEKQLPLLMLQGYQRNAKKLNRFWDKLELLELHRARKLQATNYLEKLIVSKQVRNFFGLFAS